MKRRLEVSTKDMDGVTSNNCANVKYDWRTSSIVKKRGVLPHDGAKKKIIVRSGRPLSNSGAQAISSATRNLKEVQCSLRPDAVDELVEP